MSMTEAVMRASILVTALWPDEVDHPDALPCAVYLRWVDSLPTTED